MGKSYSGQRYSVIGVWHTEFKSYKSPSLKLKVRNDDQFDFKNATGEATIEINLKLRRIVSEIQDGKIDIDSVDSGCKVIKSTSSAMPSSPTSRRITSAEWHEKSPAFDMSNRLQALPYSGLMFAFGCILYLLLWKDCEVNIITMAYIPPHLRRLKDPERPSPVPEMLEPIFNRKLKLGSSKNDTGAYSNYIEYGDHAVHRLFVCGLDSNNSISSDHFEEFPEEPDEHKRSVTINLARDNDIACANTSRSPWESIAENVWPDVLSACNIVKNEMEEKPKMNDLPSLESATERQVAETVLKPLRRCFNTPVPAAYVEKIVHEVVPKIGVDFVECKDIYNVKVVLDQVRHMVADIVCFDEDLDLRLALYTRSTLSALSDDEMNNIRILINSAIPDPKVKGGLIWPMGKSYSGNYTVVGVWHHELKSYKSPSLKLKVINVDRFRFKTGTGVATIEINLKFRRIVSEIQDGETDTDSINNGFKDNLRLIWDHFLSGED
ncbi:hypothetical protein KPL70_008975 [Citrus sinensis]|nr:hypothetical protein KPL70_008975 [Citrus sinensis]